MSFTTHRTDAVLTLADVAKEFGISPDVARDWEDGKAQRPAHVIRSLELIGRMSANENPVGLKPPQAEFDAIRDEGPLFKSDSLGRRLCVIHHIWRRLTSAAGLSGLRSAARRHGVSAAKQTAQRPCQTVYVAR